MSNAFRDAPAPTPAKTETTATEYVKKDGVPDSFTIAPTFIPRIMMY